MSTLRRLRLDAGLTQSSLARQAGISQALVSAVENGNSGLSVPALHQVAEVLAAELSESSTEIAGQLVASMSNTDPRHAA